MKVAMVIPSYWGREKHLGWKDTDSVYDHPTPLDEDGTLRRLLDSVAVLENKDFQLIVLGVANAEDIQESVEKRLSVILAEAAPAVETRLFSYSHLLQIHSYLNEKQRNNFSPLLQLDGYSNVRNLCLFVPHLLGSEVAVLIDDDEIFEDPHFMDKALEFVGSEVERDKILAVAGYYVNPNDDFFLNRETAPWTIHWNKIDCMNRAFKKIIAQGPRLKETPFAFGGNLVVHRELFSQVPFDPAITRGEDIDFLINARMFGYKVYLDNELSIKHAAPPKTYPTWRRIREDVLRFVFEKRKLDTQESVPGMEEVKAEDLDPYPGEFLKEDLEERIFRSSQILANHYRSQGDTRGASECMKNIDLAQMPSAGNPFQDLCRLQGEWKELMSLFSDTNVARNVCDAIDFTYLG